MAKTQYVDELFMDFTANTYDFEDWKLKGAQLAQVRGELSDHSQWDFGDWLVEGQKFGNLNDEELWKHAEKILKRKWQTIKNWKVVCNSFPKASGRRRDGLSFSLYMELTKFSESDQEKALDRAEELQSQLGKPLSVRDFKKEIKRLQKMDELVRDEETTDDTAKEAAATDDEVEVEFSIKLNKASYDFIDDLSVERFGTNSPKKLLGEMTVKYLVDHKDKLKAMLDSHDGRLKKGNPLP